MVPRFLEDRLRRESVAPDGRQRLSLRAQSGLHDGRQRIAGRLLPRPLLRSFAQLQPHLRPPQRDGSGALQPAGAGQGVGFPLLQRGDRGARHLRFRPQVPRRGQHGLHRFGALRPGQPLRVLPLGRRGVGGLGGAFLRAAETVVQQAETPLFAGPGRQRLRQQPLALHERILEGRQRTHRRGQDRQQFGAVGAGHEARPRYRDGFSERRTPPERGPLRREARQDADFGGQHDPDVDRQHLEGAQQG